MVSLSNHEIILRQAQDDPYPFQMKIMKQLLIKQYE